MSISTNFHGLFDRDYYRRTVPDCGAVPMRHFQSRGDAEGRDPGPYFSTAFYKQTYPDWWSRGAATAVEDYLRCLAEGVERQPHPLIDPGWYRAAYPDLAGLGLDAALHFVRHGDAEGRSPSAAFDASYYARRHMPLEAGPPFRYWSEHGQRAGHRTQAGPRDATWAQLKGAATRPLIVACHDAQPAGVPILALDLAGAAIRRGWQPVFVLLRGGPLLPRFEAKGPVILAIDGHDPARMRDGLDPGVPALIVSAAAAPLAAPLAAAGNPCLVLIHEMPDYLRDHGLVAPLVAAREAGAQLVASLPRMAEGLEPLLGRVPQIRPGITLPDTPMTAFRRVRTRMRGRGPVFVGAGYADLRKGFDLFLEAALAIAGREPQARFVWLGEMNGWARDLAADAIARGLDLTTPGFVDDAPAWYRAADLYLLTSRQDPGPTTAIHAAQMGIPFVGYAADVGLRGLVEPMAVFVPPGDVDGFARAALDGAGAVDAASRRSLRRLVRGQVGFDAYADAVLSRLEGRAAAGPASRTA